MPRSGTRAFGRFHPDNWGQPELNATRAWQWLEGARHIVGNRQIDPSQITLRKLDGYGKLAKVMSDKIRRSA